VANAETDQLIRNPKFGLYDTPAQREFGFLLVPTFSMLGFVSAVEPLRVANRLSGSALYSWRVISVTGDRIAANNGMLQSADFSVTDAPDFQTVVVCGAHEPMSFQNASVWSWLRKLAAQGVHLGAIETGSYVLAQARLLDGYRCTIHWENMPGFRETFPHIDVSGELYEFDRNRFTCAGGTAALDMMLQIIEEQHGYDLAVACAESFIYNVIRKPTDAQRMTLRERTGITNRNLLECLELMEANVEQPLTPAELADAVGVSKRQLERLFQRYMAATPARYYTELRLRQGRRLLEQTSMPITDVALACGFPSPGYFSHRYRALFGLSPREQRATHQRRDNRGTPLR
jgi:transcriptional regulator GlxA family with amidase domain